MEVKRLNGPRHAKKAAIPMANRNDTRTKTGKKIAYRTRKKALMLTEDQVNHILNDQEDAIAELKHKLLAMEDARDVCLGKSLELLSAMQRIECLQNCECSEIARRAIDDFQGK